MIITWNPATERFCTPDGETSSHIQIGDVVVSVLNMKENVITFVFTDRVTDRPLLAAREAPQLAGAITHLFTRHAL